MRSTPSSSGRSVVSLLPPEIDMRFNVFAVVLLLAGIAAGWIAAVAQHQPLWIVAGVIIGGICALSPRVAKQWERGIVLRLGRYVGSRGPGLFWIVPFVEGVSTWIDQRTITTSFDAEQTLTSDTVPVNVDAVLFWVVHDPEKAALEVQDYSNAVSLAAQTALRDIIGRTSLTELLRGRAAAARQGLRRRRERGDDTPHLRRERRHDRRRSERLGPRR